MGMACYFAKTKTGGAATMTSLTAMDTGRVIIPCLIAKDLDGRVINVINLKNHRDMKKKNLIIVLTGVLLSIFIFSSCEDMFDEKSLEESCHDKGWLYCDTGDGKCCSNDVPYHDGHGTCYSSLSYCRQSGWACTKCW